MPKFKNTSQGLRGVNVEGNSTVWLEPGQVKSVDNALDDQHPDIEKTSEKETPAPQEADEHELREADADDMPVKGEVKPNDAFDDMPDDGLRDAVEDKTGERPHHRTSRAKLLEMLRS